MRAYLYAILRASAASPPALPVVGPSSGALETRRMGALALAFSPIEAAEALPSRRNMLAHTKILEALHRQGPILPCRFGMIAHSPVEAEAMIAPQAERLLASLARLEGRVELGLRVSLVEQAAIARIVAEAPHLPSMSREAGRAAPREAHRMRLDLGREIAHRLALRRAKVADEMTAMMADFAEDRVIHATSDDLSAFHGAFLVRAEDEAAIMRRIEAYDAQNSDWLTIRCVVPAPPYHFVAFSLGRQPQAA